MPAVEVIVGRLDPDPAEVARLSARLSGEERVRAERFRFEADRRRFIVRRGLLREWLAEHLGCRAEGLGFVTGEHGKPALADGRCHFNLSHSGEVVMLALSTREVGCDVERIDPALDWRDLAGSLFPRDVVADLEARREPVARAGFFRAWARLEAEVKAVGLGLGTPVADRGAGWLVSDVAAIVGHAAAVAVRDDGTPLRVSIRQPQATLPA